MIVWGVIAIFAAFGALGLNAPVAAVFWAAVGSVLIAYGIHRNKQRQQQTVIINNYTMPPQQPAPGNDVRASARVYTPKVFPVAGVTFQNDDGSSRQDILREICAGNEDGSTEAWLEWHQFNGQDAYRVMTQQGCVGNVRKIDIVKAVTAIGASNVDLNVELFETDDGRTIYRADLIV